MIFETLSKEKNLEVDDYIKQYSQKFIHVKRDGIQNLDEDEADKWINKAYLLSL